MIVCVLIPYFAATIETVTGERRRDPALSGVPFIIFDPDQGRKIYGTSAEAAALGIRPGMPWRQAQILAPKATAIPANPLRYRQVYERLLDTLAAFTPFIEPGTPLGQRTKSGKRRSKTQGPPPAFASDDGLSAVFYLDLESLEIAHVVQLCQRLRHAVRSQTGLIPSLGIARGKFPARVAAALAPPDTESYVPAGGEAAFLAPLPIATLPLDLETARRLRLLGIETLGQLASLPIGAVTTQFGKPGSLLHHLAEGHDDRRIVPYRPKAVEQVTRSLDGSVADRTVLEDLLRKLADEMAARLQARASAGRELELILCLENGAVREDRLVLRQPVASAGHIAEILNQLLARTPLISGVVSVEIRMTDLVQSAGRQLDLFVHQAGQERLLRLALKDVIARYGEECFYWIKTADSSARLPARRFKLDRADVS